MKNKICFINVYFGKLPNYFQLWLNSCKYNETINFLIFTDDTTAEYNIPNNVRIINTTLDYIRKKIQKCFEFNISIDYAYKLCDYKPAYGLIFCEYLKDYDYWGHCDIDVIFGNLRKYITNDILEKYDKIFRLGHLTLYKNTDSINNNFKELVDENGKLMYKEVYTSNISYYFDETKGITQLYNNNKYKYSMYVDDSIIADISIKYNNFVNCFALEDGKCVFSWKHNNDSCKLIGYFKIKDKLMEKEYMYIHLQKRNMSIMNKNNYENLLIYPNKFVNYIQVDSENFEKYTKKITLYRKDYFKLKVKRLKQRIFEDGIKI